MSGFLQRAITAALFAIVMIGGIWWHIYSCTALFCLIAILSLWEYLRLWKPEEKSAHFLFRYPTMLLGTVFMAFSALINLGLLPGKVYYGAIPLVFLLFLLGLWSKSRHPFKDIATQVLGLVYIILAFSLALFIVFPEGNFQPMRLLGVLFLVWTNDTMAYITGSKLGRTKLFERISPKKTWEGTIGGIVCCIGVGFVLSIYFDVYSRTDWIVIAALVSVFGTYGDLVESLMKRKLGVKDSGNILPGHGGMLDRFDAFMFALPFVFGYLSLFS